MHYRILPVLRGLLLAISFFFFTVNSSAQTKAQLDSLNESVKSLVCVNSNKADSVLQNIKSIAENNSWDSQLATATRLIGYNKLCTGDLQGSKPIFKNAIAIARRAENKREVAFASKELGSAHLRLSELDSADEMSKTLLGIAKELQDSTLIALGYQFKCGLHTMRSENDSIIYYAVKGLKYLETTPNIGIESALLINIGNAYYQNEDYPSSLEYFGSARVLIEKSGNLRNLNIILYNLATGYTRVEQFDSASHYYLRSIDLNKEQGRKYLLTYSYQGYADLLFDTEDYHGSIKYNLLSKSLSEELGEKRSLGTVHANLIDAYNRTGQYSKAIETGKIAIEIFKEIEDRDKLADAYFLLSQAYEAVGDFQNSLKFHQNFYSIDSSLISTSRHTIINELETKYQTEKKEAEIAELSAQSTIQALELRQKNQWILIGLIGFVLVGAIAFFFSRTSSIQKQKAKTELEQRFLRSQLNPHFISNALLAVQNFMLKNEANKAGIYLAKFSKLMRQILENSRQEFITVEEEVQMLQDFMDIHKLRLGNAFQYEINIDENIDPEMDTIPPMFVQPFVENAIEHGISPDDDKGLITLNLSKVGNFIGIEILDNGKGIESASTKAEDHVSLSTKIIKERMELFNRSLQDKIQLVLGEVKSENGEVLGTKVSLKVPFSYS